MEIKSITLRENVSLYTKEKIRGMFEIQKSGGKTSSGEIGRDITNVVSSNLEHMQVPKYVYRKKITRWNAYGGNSFWWIYTNLGQNITGQGQIKKEHGSLPNHIARTLTARRICLGRSKSSILI